MHFQKTALLFLLSLLLASWYGSAPVLGQQTMEVKVSEPGANEYPTAKIKLKFAFNNLGSSTPSVTLGGSTADLGSPSSFTTQFGNGVGGGRMKFFKPTGSSGVGVLEIYPDGLLGSNGCSVASDFQNEHTYSIDLDLPQDVTLDTYSLTSYRVLSGAACNLVARRNTNKDPGAKWVQRPSSGTEVERLPINVAMVLDKSGSMSESAGNDSKISVLKESANQLIDNWRALSPTHEDDSLGVVFFDRNVDPVTIDGNVFVRRTGTSSSSSSHPWNDFGNEIDQRNASGRTAMGDGMQRAFEELKALNQGQAGAQDRAMIVLTDGKQNEGDEVHQCDDFPSFATGGACGGDQGVKDVYALKEYNSSSITTLPTRETVIQTVYVGPPGSQVAELMSGIAWQNGGVPKNQPLLRYDPSQTTGTNPNFGFLQTLEDILRGYSPEVVLEEGGTASSVATTHRFYVPRTAEYATLTLDWLEIERRGALDIELVDPNNEVVEPDLRFDRNGYSVLGIELRDGERRGEWKARVTAAEAPDASYHLTTILEDQSFSSELELEKPIYSTGDTLRLELQLTQGGEPITDVTNIRARVFAPQEGTGTLLHQREPDQHVDLPDDQASPYTQKLYSLYQSEEVRNLISPVLRDSVRLVDNRNESSEDETQDDRVYTAQIEDLQVPGNYQFSVELDFETEELGRIRRVKTAETVVRVRPTLEASEVDVQESNGDTVVNLVPKDSFGNFLGPGYEDQIHIRTEEGESLDPEITDQNVTGEYQIFLTGLAPDSDQPLQISVNGFQLENTSLAELRGDGGKDDGQDGDDGEMESCSIGGNSNSATTGLLLVFGLAVVGLVAYRRRDV